MAEFPNEIAARHNYSILAAGTVLSRVHLHSEHSQQWRTAAAHAPRRISAGPIVRRDETRQREKGI